MIQWLIDSIRTLFCSQERFEETVTNILTHGHGELSGEGLRMSLRGQGLRFSGPGFYERMSRMEGSGAILCERRPVRVGDQEFKQNWYRLPREP